MFDPNAEDYKKERTKWLTEKGRHTFAAVGFERFNSSTKGTPMLGVRLVVIDGPEWGKVFVPEFAMSDAALWKFAEFCRALKQDSPFDPNDNEALGAVLVNGFFTADCEPETYNGFTRLKAGDFEPFSGKLSHSEDEVNALIEETEKAHMDYLEWRAKPGNSRAEKAATKKQKGGGGGGGNGGGGNPDGDIPF